MFRGYPGKRLKVAQERASELLARIEKGNAQAAAELTFLMEAEVHIETLAHWNRRARTQLDPIRGIKGVDEAILSLSQFHTSESKISEMRRSCNAIGLIARRGIDQVGNVVSNGEGKIMEEKE